MQQTNAFDKTSLPFQDNKFQKSLAYLESCLNSLERKGVETYADHGVKLSQTFAEITNDPSLHSIVLLHDILTHPKGRELLRNAPLKKDEQTIIRKLHNLRNLNIDTNLADLDRAMESFSEDYRILLMRMSHRLNDIREINKFEKARGKKIARETLHMYTPLAGRIGLHKWRYEMEDVCFRYLYPAASKKLEKRFRTFKKRDLLCLGHTQKFLVEKLTEANISSRLETRIKTLYSTYRKMIFKNRKFEDLTDRLAIRIITNNKDDCYRALGVVHSVMNPVPGKLKDYIGAPKENGYQSIHTVVYPLPGVTSLPIEIQIRTEDMHKECEFGIAAGLYYKKKGYKMRYNIKTKIDLVKNLEILRNETNSAKGFSKLLQMYFRGDQVLVFDHSGQLHYLKSGATAFDFVRLLYGKRADYLKFVKLNGIKSNVKIPLQDGDVLEAKFSKRKTRMK